jgi:hypothetical protein
MIDCLIVYLISIVLWQPLLTPASMPCHRVERHRVERQKLITHFKYDVAVRRRSKARREGGRWHSSTQQENSAADFHCPTPFILFASLSTSRIAAV